MVVFYSYVNQSLEKKCIQEVLSVLKKDRKTSIEKKENKNALL